MAWPTYPYTTADMAAKRPLFDFQTLPIKARKPPPYPGELHPGHHRLPEHQQARRGNLSFFISDFDELVSAKRLGWRWIMRCRGSVGFVSDLGGWAAEYEVDICCWSRCIVGFSTLHCLGELPSVIRYLLRSGRFLLFPPLRSGRSNFAIILAIRPRICKRRSH